MTGISKSNYRWYILALAALTFAFASGVQRMCMPVLFKEVSVDLGLNAVEIGTIWGMDPLAGVFVALLGGLLVDRFGIKRTLAVICFLAGVFGALRGVSVSFISLLGIMFVFGLLVAALPSVVPKTTAMWFGGYRLGLANGIIIAVVSAGQMASTMLSATVFSPLLGGWRNVLFLYAVPPAIISLLWLLTGREPAKGETPATMKREMPFRQALSRVVRIKGVWIMGLIMMGQQGSWVGVTGYLPLYLRDIGWNPASADGAMTALLGASVIGAISITSLSDRLGSRKKVLIASILIMATCMGLLMTADAVTAWVLIIIYGLMRGGTTPLITTMLLETRGVGGSYAGTAVGVMYTFGMLGGFFSPPLGNSLANTNPGFPFLVWTALSILILFGFFFVKESRQCEDEAASADADIHRGD